jgi:hypothetical protein
MADEDHPLDPNAVWDAFRDRVTPRVRALLDGVAPDAVPPRGLGDNSFSDAMANTLRDAGGPDYFATVASERPSTFMSFVAKLATDQPAVEPLPVLRRIGDGSGHSEEALGRAIAAGGTVEDITGMTTEQLSKFMADMLSDRIDDIRELARSAPFNSSQIREIVSELFSVSDPDDRLWYRERLKLYDGIDGVDREKPVLPGPPEAAEGAREFRPNFEVLDGDNRGE